ncbi:zinc-dependent metalloprotease [Rhodoflexus caldus]|uniref:zinc-dependent metalloprotease n=1 Tax=Rhodoflexus caldus TaxID=2891236 RepID=UPI00202A43CA|nr:zinc-dependent metalloprotease [Rhodoflexus caldus]
MRLFASAQLKMLLLFCTAFYGGHMYAQSLPSIASKTAGMKKYEGFFNFWIDEAQGKLWLEVDKWDTEFLYINSLPGGLGSNDIGLDRGQLGEERIVKFHRVGKKVLLVQPNYRYRAVTNQANEKRAVEESFAQSALWGFTAEAADGNKVLIDATDFLLRDSHKVAETIRRMRQGSYRPDASRSALYLPRTKNFPLNTEMEATITFVGGEDAGNFVQSVVPSPEAITLRTHHSFVQLPDNQYQPRVLDPRSSYMSVSFYDYSTPVTEPIEKHYIVRHRLEKKDPNAAVSEPVKPIVYYLDNGTPEPIRTALLEGARWWAKAFEAAGFKNAFRVEILPEGADMMDVRYNVIQWVHRSTRGWSYGASVVDPRTGEIIKGHVSLGSLRVRQDYLIFTGLLSPFEKGEKPSEKMLNAALHRLRQLSAHEVGHTLGLMHNYAASTNNRASVMDYPHPWIKLDKNGDLDFGDVYTDEIGEWDKVSITYGYQTFPKGTDDAAASRRYLDEVFAKGMRYISDRDARAPGGMHPYAHLWDNGTDAADELRNVLAVRKKALDKFSEKAVREGEPLAFLEDVLVPVYNYHRYQAEAAVKLIGGVDYTYALRGDNQTVTQILDVKQQQKALDAVLECIKPETLTLPERIVAMIPPRPANYAFTRELFNKRTGLLFDPLAAAEAAADLPLGLLFHPERASRLVLLEARGSGLGLSSVIDQVINATWKATRQSGLAAQIQLQTEQMVLTHLLALSVNESANYQARAVVSKKLNDLRTYLQGNRLSKNIESIFGSGNQMNEHYLAHIDYALERMKAPEKAKVSTHKELPPGAPIGCGE